MTRVIALLLVLAAAAGGLWLFARQGLFKEIARDDAPMTEGEAARARERGDRVRQPDGAPESRVPPPPVTYDRTRRTPCLAVFDEAAGGYAAAFYGDGYTVLRSREGGPTTGYVAGIIGRNRLHRLFEDLLALGLRGAMPAGAGPLRVEARFDGRDVSFRTSPAGPAAAPETPAPRIAARLLAEAPGIGFTPWRPPWVGLRAVAAPGSKPVQPWPDEIPPPSALAAAEQQIRRDVLIGRLLTLDTSAPFAHAEGAFFLRIRVPMPHE